MKDKLNNLVLKYETLDFVKTDPIQFPHRFKEKTDIEIAAFISSLFAFGKRELFINKLNFLFSLAQTPQELIFDFKKYNTGVSYNLWASDKNSANELIQKITERTKL